jgi:hypothetical protein
MKIYTLPDITQSFLLHAGYLFDLFFDPEDVGHILLRNLGIILNGLYSVI